MKNNLNLLNNIKLKTQQEVINQISEEVLNYLLNYKRKHPDFTFSLRSRNSPQSKEKRLENGQWFQGSHYIYVPLFRKGDSKNKTKTIGFVINLEGLDIVGNYIEITFKAESEPENEKLFHTELANELDVELSEKFIHGFKYYNNPNNYLENLESFLEKVRPVALRLLKKYDIESQYLISEEKFNKSLNKIEEFRTLLNMKTGNHDNKIKVLRNKGQIILQGPPGTGKTYTAKDIAEKMILGSVSPDKKVQKKILENSDQFELVQFHPSYSYEDFVRGITAKSNNGQVEYKTENKVLAEFADTALQNLLDSKKDSEELSKEQYVTELINEFAEKVQNHIEENNSYPITNAVAITDVEHNAFRYTGAWKTSQRMKFKDLIKAVIYDVKTRAEFKEIEGISGLAKQHASYFFKVSEKFKAEFKSKLDLSKVKAKSKIERKDYILIIDEINRANLPSVLGELIYALEYRGEKVSSMYEIDGENSIIIPENLYIVGTMNTADRSVGHIDYAIKRRFAFINILPNEVVIENSKAKELFREVSKLFEKEFLAPDFDINDVQLGHSYFIVKDEEELKMRLKYEIIPILNEYIKDGLLLENANSKIKELESFV